jgi:hypothetical protein
MDGLTGAAAGEQRWQFALIRKSLQRRSRLSGTLAGQMKFGNDGSRD